MNARTGTCPYVIAEAGVNHNGDMDLARRLIDAAADAGADAVKFQTFSADALASENAPKAAYQNVTTDAAESQLDMLRKLEISHDDHFHLMAHAEQRGIDFLSSPFDEDSIRFLAETLKLKTLKIPSGEITNAPFLLKAGRSGCDIILSTGMSMLDDVAGALDVLAFAMSGEQNDATPSRQAFAAARASVAGQAALTGRVTLLQCTSQYPTPAAGINLRAMATLAETFSLPVGFSDHSEGIAVAIAAAALGAVVIEKHFTMDRTLPGPDHKASLEPGELKDMMAGIRAAAAALGDGDKTPRACELETRAIARKSLVATRPIKAGETLGPDNIGIKRPGTGISPMSFWDYCGTPAGRDYDTDDLIES